MSISPVRNVAPYIKQYSKPLPNSAPNPIFRGEAKPTKPASEFSLHAKVSQYKFNNVVREYVHKMESIKADMIEISPYKNLKMRFDGKPNG